MVFKDGGQVNTMLNFLIPDLSLRTPERVLSGANWEAHLQIKDTTH